jgi:hypothetical protein
MSKQNIVVINPRTQRVVKYGSRVYKQLVKDGIIDNDDNEDETPNIKTRQQPYKQPIQHMQSKQPNNYDYDYEEPPKQHKTMTRQTKSKPIKIEYKQTYEDEIDKLLNDAFTIDLKSSRNNNNNNIQYVEEDEEDEESDNDDY